MAFGDRIGVELSEIAIGDVGAIEPVIARDVDETPRRKRGTGTDASTEFATVDPASLGNNGSGTDEPKPRKRGRPAGAGTNAPRKAKTKETGGLETFSYCFCELHKLMARVYDMPELIMVTEEGQQVGRALHTAMEYYGVDVPKPVQAVSALIGTFSMVYGPKIKAIQDRKAGRTNQRLYPPNSGAPTEQSAYVDIFAPMG